MVKLNFTIKIKNLKDIKINLKLDFFYMELILFLVFLADSVKIFKDQMTLLGVMHLRVELYTIDRFSLVFHCFDFADI